MASGFGNYLRAKIKERGWSDRHFAELADIKPSALSYILTTPGAVPTIRTLDKISTALSVDLEELILACGITLNRNPAQSRAARLRLLADVIPEVQRLLDDAVQLTPKDLRAVQAYVDRIVEEVQDRRAPPHPDNPGAGHRSAQVAHSSIAE